jgi:hypothetical protein
MTYLATETDKAKTVSLLARITSRRETTTNSMQRGVQIILLHVVEEIRIRFPNMYLVAVNYTYSLEKNHKFFERKCDYIIGLP